MPRIFLHAGTHKTGTTTIQRALFANREMLASNGIWYDPGADLFGGTRHAAISFAHQLAYADDVATDTRFQTYRERIEHALSEGQDIIISAEPLYRMVMGGGSSAPRPEALTSRVFLAFSKGCPYSPSSPFVVRID
ncbi:hypothetical protein SAMN05421688_0564 [Poseidonocella pacifica]|uniref:Uncharacterized protein n=1 Tax=Poseidonocella pacifica TaxID=871651 RepID=A0A1I0VFI5_9RHOB|nr:hypothetical protein [Poseidonocella pacifica]SFA74740.1 hypothetical protein SAMN05421688_0564 [Poseidonocella pacifica]